MTARDEILSRIRKAVADGPQAGEVPRDYRRAGTGTPTTGKSRTTGQIEASREQSIDLFIERLLDYRANVHRTTAGVHDGSERSDGPEPTGSAISRILGERGITRIVIPDGFPAAWKPSVSVISEPVDLPTLDEVGAVLTTCAVAVAETGTIVLDAGPGMGPRALSLVPDYHLIVVREDQVRPHIPDAVARIEPRRPLTWISGPSATSDIELNRVEGVHGPRTLDVLIVAAEQ